MQGKPTGGSVLGPYVRGRRDQAPWLRDSDDDPSNSEYQPTGFRYRVDAVLLQSRALLASVDGLGEGLHALDPGR